MKDNITKINSELTVFNKLFRQSKLAIRYTDRIQSCRREFRQLTKTDRVELKTIKHREKSND